MISGNWRPVALEFAEQDALSTFVDLHEFQLQQLSCRRNSPGQTAHNCCRAVRRRVSGVHDTGNEP